MVDFGVFADFVVFAVFVDFPDLGDFDDLAVFADFAVLDDFVDFVDFGDFKDFVFSELCVVPSPKMSNINRSSYVKSAALSHGSDLKVSSISISGFSTATQLPILDQSTFSKKYL